MKPTAIFNKAFTSIAFGLIVMSTSACDSGSKTVYVAPEETTPAAPSDQPVPDAATITRMEARLEDIGKCALRAGDASGITFQNYAQKLADKGIVQELQADAQSIASEDIAFFERTSPSNSDATRISNYLSALNSTGFVLTHPPEVRLKANAYVAYYQSMLTGQQCPVDQDILQFINKTKP